MSVNGFELTQNHIDEYGLADLEQGEIAYIIRLKPYCLSFSLVCSACGGMVESKVDYKLAVVFVRPCACSKSTERMTNR